MRTVCMQIPEFYMRNLSTADFGTQEGRACSTPDAKAGPYFTGGVKRSFV